LKSPRALHPSAARRGADSEVGGVVRDRQRDAFADGLAAGSKRNAQKLSVIEKIAVCPAKPGQGRAKAVALAGRWAAMEGSCTEPRWAPNGAASGPLHLRPEISGCRRRSMNHL